MTQPNTGPALAAPLLSSAGCAAARQRRLRRSPPAKLQARRLGNAWRQERAAGIRRRGCGGEALGDDRARGLVVLEAPEDIHQAQPLEIQLPAAQGIEAVLRQGRGAVLTSDAGFHGGRQIGVPQRGKRVCHWHLQGCLLHQQRLVEAAQTLGQDRHAHHAVAQGFQIGVGLVEVVQVTADFVGQVQRGTGRQQGGGAEGLGLVRECAGVVQVDGVGIEGEVILNECRLVAIATLRREKLHRIELDLELQQERHPRCAVPDRTVASARRLPVVVHRRRWIVGEVLAGGTQHRKGRGRVLPGRVVRPGLGCERFQQQRLQAGQAKNASASSAWSSPAAGKPSAPGSCGSAAALRVTAALPATAPAFSVSASISCAAERAAAPLSPSLS